MRVATCYLHTEYVTQEDETGSEVPATTMKGELSAFCAMTGQCNPPSQTVPDGSDSCDGYAAESAVKYISRKGLATFGIRNLPSRISYKKGCNNSSCAATVVSGHMYVRPLPDKT